MDSENNNSCYRKRVRIEGIVQGVGFRPFVYQLACNLGISGWVRNDSRGVLVEVEGEIGALSRFLWSLRSDVPPLASVTLFEMEDLPPEGAKGFSILSSEVTEGLRTQVAPDSHVCEDCLSELFNPGDRRYGYPLINCTNCGPRFSIVTGIPYDRPQTTMVDFPMCPQCLAEYTDPLSRRFHAQPNACPDCGPQLRLLNSRGQRVEGDPVQTAVELLKQGKVLAVKSLGGYHLAVDAANDEAVRELRRRKARDEKPFALMSSSIEEVVSYTAAGETEVRLLCSVERPIVLVRQKPNTPISEHVAPGNNYYGVMLPSAPLQYLLLRKNFLALVMTSGNLSDEPIAFEDADAMERLAGIADYFFVHDRRIQTRTDDSIARVMAGKAMLIRRSRGFVPRGIFLPTSQVAVLAVGAELKSAVCLTDGDRAFLGPHVGDLKKQAVFESFIGNIDHLKSLLEIEPQIIAHDLHPDYYSTRYAEQVSGLHKIGVQHHHAHLASCMAENGVSEPCIGVVFDGTGYGEDGHIWGGEFLVGDFEGYRRAGHLAYVPMPGGDAAVKEPFRMALAYLQQAYGDKLPSADLLSRISPPDLKLLGQMIAKSINSPLTSSAGRLFDAVSALLGIRDRVSFEGQAALELEMQADQQEKVGYPYDVLEDDKGLTVRFDVMIRAMVDDLANQIPVALISGRFHNTLAFVVAEVCTLLRNTTGLNRVALSGGVFQNCLLTEKCIRILSRGGFEVLTHSLVPPNDGGLALGQAVIAGKLLSTHPV